MFLKVKKKNYYNVKCFPCISIADSPWECSAAFQLRPKIQRHIFQIMIRIKSLDSWDVVVVCHVVFVASGDGWLKKSLICGNRLRSTHCSRAVWLLWTKNGSRTWLSENYFIFFLNCSFKLKFSPWNKFT